MKRRNFLQTLMWLPLTGKAMKLIEQEFTMDAATMSKPMPVLFIGHGSPMNAIEDNEFSRGWQQIARSVPAPRAILCVSAHWETRGTLVTAVEKPRTIHDFYGFPDQLFTVQYPAPGSPEVAAETIASATPGTISADREWGLDHGAWSVLRHLYPEAVIPVLQLSLDYTRKPAEHFELAKTLSALRRKGVLIVGSGNIVHNLRMMDWKSPEAGFPWAEEAEEVIRNKIADGDHRALFSYPSLGKSIQLAVPTPEHFLPLLYILALQESGETINIFNDKRVYGSVSMTSILIK